MLSGCNERGNRLNVLLLNAIYPHVVSGLKTHFPLNKKHTGFSGYILPGHGLATETSWFSS